MAGFIILLVVAVGLYKRGGRRFEWSRGSLGEAAAGAVGAGGRALGRGRRSLPAVLGQCVTDVRDLVDDMLGLIDPKARRRIEERARAMMSRAEQHRVALGSGTSRLAAAGPRRSGAYESLQRSYLEGSISLERYVEEAERLRRRR